MHFKRAGNLVAIFPQKQRIGFLLRGNHRMRKLIITRYFDTAKRRWNDTTPFSLLQLPIIGLNSCTRCSRNRFRLPPPAVFSNASTPIFQYSCFDRIDLWPRDKSHFRGYFHILRSVPCSLIRTENIPILDSRVSMYVLFYTYRNAWKYASANFAFVVSILKNNWNRGPLRVLTNFDFR